MALLTAVVFVAAWPLRVFRLPGSSVLINRGGPFLHVAPVLTVPPSRNALPQNLPIQALDEAQCEKSCCLEPRRTLLQAEMDTVALLNTSPT